MPVIIKKSLVQYLPSIEKVDFCGGGQGISVSITTKLGSELSDDVINDLTSQFNDFFYDNAESPNHDAFYHSGSMKFDAENPLKVLHDFYYDDIGQGLTEFDDFSDLRSIIDDALTPYINELEGINNIKIEPDSIELDGSYSNPGGLSFTIRETTSGHDIQLTPEIQKNIENVVGDYLKNAADIWCTDKTIIDDIEIYESEVGSVSISWQDEYELVAVDDASEE
jgi:galactitol-specific phosphotransferase system IIB component